MGTEFQFHRWDEPSVRQTYLQWMMRRLESVFEHFPFTEISLTPTVRQLALTNVANYNLGAHDAVHLASAQRPGVLDIASFDRGYERVDDLFLWNDRVHERTSGKKGAR